MDFGKLPSVDGVRFDVPPIDDRGRAILAHAKAQAAPQWLRVGGPGWARRDWLGKLYPQGTPARDFLRVYARALDAIELNASGYALPDPKTVAAWKDDVPEAFRFCPKLPRAITHEQALVGADLWVEQTIERFTPLGVRLGPMMLQLPPFFGPERLPALAAFLRRWPRGCRLAVELRHPAWFARRALRPVLRDLLEDHGVGTVITDVAGRRDVSHGSLTAPFALVRFVGNDLHPTDAPRVDAWIDTLFAWREAGLREAFFFVHEPDDRYAPEMMAHAVARARGKGAQLSPVSLHAPRAQLDLFG
jgi:uncharacterized protein YecE (DUF72 family)